MDTAQLTQRQINLLHLLVDHQQNGRLIEPFGTIPISASEYVIYIHGQSSMRIHHAQDLDALCISGYLEYKWNRLSNAKLYVVSKSARLAFKSGELLVHKDENASLAPISLKSEHLPPETETFMALLNETNRVRGQLKREITAVLHSIELGDTVAELTAVQELYYAARPNTAVIAQHLHTIGQKLTAQLIVADDTDGQTAVACSLSTFGIWTQLIFQLCHHTSPAL